MKKLFFLFVFVFMFLTIVNADVLSINSGGDNQLIINPNLYLEGFFSSFNNVPIIWNVILSSSLGTNTTNENLTVSYSASDPDFDVITNISDWRIGGDSITVLNMPFDTKKIQGTVRDYSTYENNGTLGGGNSDYSPIWNSNCQVGGCYDFDGVDDYIYLAPDSSLSPQSDNYSVSFWINCPSGLTSFRAMISSYRTAVSNTDALSFINPANNKARFYVRDRSNHRNYRDTGSDVCTDSWNYLVATWDGNSDTINLYVNGDLNQGSQTNVGGAIGNIDTGEEYYIGKRTPTYGGFIYNGSLDDLLVFNRALTPEQISLIYQSGLSGHNIETFVSQETIVGETWQVAMTPNDHLRDGITVLSNELTIVNDGPNEPTDVLLYSLNGRNESDTDLNCTGFISDPDNSGSLTVEVNWSENNVSQMIFNYTGINNGTIFGAILDNGNLTLGDIWKCSLKVYDLNDVSSSIDSNELEIIDITPPIIYVESPINNNNYTSLDIFFNVSLNEAGDACLYDLDFNGNVTMNQTNVTHFTYLDPTIGPGDHDLWFYCNDTSGNWNSTYVNFSINNDAAISILMSDSLLEGVLWDLLTLPAEDLDAVGNNLGNATDYYLNVSAVNTLVDIYVRADGDLFNLALDSLGLHNETYVINLTDANVTNGNKVNMTTDYVLIADAIGTSMVYMKFYLDAPVSQPAGIYKNNLEFKAVRDGQPI